jgi:hypothetical protein
MATKTGSTAPSSPPFAKGSIIWERKGPLPVWAWALIGLLVVLVFTWWRRNRASANEAATGGAVDQALPGDQGAPPVFIMPPSVSPIVNVSPVVKVKTPPPTTVPPAPPAAGREDPPGVPAMNPDKAKTHTQGHAGENVYDWAHYYFGPFVPLNKAFAEWERINAQFNPRSNVKWLPTTKPQGEPVFKETMTYRLPGYEIAVYGKTPA